MRSVSEFSRARVGPKGDRPELKGRRGGDKGKLCAVNVPDGACESKYGGEKCPKTMRRRCVLIEAIVRKG